MNSLVLKPCRWVVFLLVVIPGSAPSPALRPATLATGAPRRSLPRGACEVRRVAADFLAPRLTPADLFLCLRRGLSATAYAWVARPLESLGNRCEKICSPQGALRQRLSSNFTYITHFWLKSKPYGTAKILSHGNTYGNPVTRLMEAKAKTKL